MIQNYIRIAFRTMMRNKGFTIINISGLAIGLTAGILILLFIRQELDFDKCFADFERVYRVAVKGRMSGDYFDVAVTPSPMAPAIKRAFPETEIATRIQRSEQQALLSSGENSFYERGAMYADSSFFDLFDFQPLIGDLKTALYEPFSIVLTKSGSEKYFGNTNPLGQTLRLNDAFTLKVTAVISDPPANTHIKFPFLISWSSLRKMFPERNIDNWGSLSIYTYVKLAENTDPKAFSSKIEKMIMQNLIAESGQDSSAFQNLQLEFNAYLQPLEQIHLHSNLMAEMTPNSDISYIYTFSAIAVFILIIASINFMNLTTARSARRAREVGIRKVLGGYRRQLIYQFISESVIMTLIALVIALIMVELLLPVFSSMIGQQIDNHLMAQPQMLLVYLILALFVGFLSGTYPSFYLSSFQTARVLKGSVSRKSGNAGLRNVLVVFQFSISVFLIIGTGIIYTQLNYLKNKRLGFDRENLLILQFRNDELRNKFSVFKNEFARLSMVSGTAGASAIPGEGTNGTAFFPEGISSSDPWLIFNTEVDHDYINTMGMELIMGRNFSREFKTDTLGIIINETLWKKLGWGDQALGKKFRVGSPNEGPYFHVIGVVKDFHFESLHDKIEPLVLFLRPDRFNVLFLRLRPSDLKEDIEKISEKWDQLSPNFPFEYHFLDQSFNEMYKSEQKLATLFVNFAVIAIFIACLGLFGLSSYMAEQRTKEIGVRKTFGATSRELVYLLTRDFIKWVLLANLIAWPLAWYFLDNWLQDFAYRISITDHWPVFFYAAIVSFVIAILTVAAQAAKVAHSNPVTALKYDG